MGALGDYVHMLYRNYQRYGVGRTNQEPLSKALINYKKAIDNRINESSKIKQENVQQLERRIKLNSNNSLKNSQDDWTKKQQQYIDQIYNLLFERSREVSGVQRVYNIAQGQHFITKKGKVKNINIGGEHWAASKSIQDLRLLRKQAQIKFDQIQNLITKINNSSIQSQEDLQKLITLYQAYTHLNYDSNDHTLGAIEKAIGEKRYDGVVSAVGGNFGEMFIATCDDRAFNGAVNSVNQLIEQNVKGAQKSEISFAKSLISKNRGDKFFKTDVVDDTLYTIGATQDKVDVEIKVNNSDVFASVKSYSGVDTKSTQPHLQDVKLFYTLTFLNNEQQFKDIGNHWLNIHASHEDRRKQIINYQLDEIIKKEVALQALSYGNPFKKNINNANVFVYINRTTGKVYVKSVKDILFNEFGAIKGLDEIPKIYLDNHKDDKIQDRITNVLSQLHQQTISVGLNVNFN